MGCCYRVISSWSRCEQRSVDRATNRRMLLRSSQQGASCRQGIPVTPQSAPTLRQGPQYCGISKRMGAVLPTLFVSVCSSIVMLLTKVQYLVLSQFMMALEILACQAQEPISALKLFMPIVQKDPSRGNLPANISCDPQV